MIQAHDYKHVFFTSSVNSINPTYQCTCTGNKYRMILLCRYCRLALTEHVGVRTFRTLTWMIRVRIYPVGSFSYFVAFRWLIQHSLQHSATCLSCTAFESLPRNLMSLLKLYVVFLSSKAHILEKYVKDISSVFGEVNFCWSITVNCLAKLYKQYS